MRKIAIPAIITLIVFTTNPVNKVLAQVLYLGGGAAAGSGFKYHRVRSGIPGLFIRSSYQISEALQTSVSAAMFYPNKDNTEDGARRTWLGMIDLDGQYIFARSGTQVSFYALVGLDVNFLSSKYMGDELYPNDFSDNYLGLNMGIGTTYQISGSTQLLAEIKYTAGKFHQWTLFAGFLVSTEGWFKKKK